MARMSEVHAVQRAGACPPHLRRKRAQRRSAFTLIETAFSTVIIGVGVLAIIEAQQTFLEKNAWSTHTSTATFLANELREMTRSFPRHDRFSGGLYFVDPDDTSTFTGWGPEDDETLYIDLDDLDDLDGAVFGDATTLPDGFTMTSRYPGPIDAFGNVITETLWDGTTQYIVVEGVEQPVSLLGWTQIVEVDKVDPADFSVVVNNDEREVSFEGDVEREVDQYPLRISVTILYQGEFDTDAPPITTVTWIVPP